MNEFKFTQGLTRLNRWQLIDIAKQHDLTQLSIGHESFQSPLEDRHGNKTAFVNNKNTDGGKSPRHRPIPLPRKITEDNLMERISRHARSATKENCSLACRCSQKYGSPIHVSFNWRVCAIALGLYQIISST